MQTIDKDLLDCIKKLTSPRRISRYIVMAAWAHTQIIERESGSFRTANLNPEPPSYYTYSCIQ